jgi:hypothetical protein
VTRFLELDAQTGRLSIMGRQRAYKHGPVGNLSFGSVIDIKNNPVAGLLIWIMKPLLSDAALTLSDITNPCVSSSYKNRGGIADHTLQSKITLGETSRRPCIPRNRSAAYD